ncbi:MAG: hypothetical protein Kapaf2KO_06910 [Candidatus Kapaibacteriales bacterium]
MKNFINTSILILIIVSIFLNNQTLLSQDIQDDGFTDNKVNLLFGLNQPLLGGFNIEGNYFVDRLAFDYSHGVSLNIDNEFLGEDAMNQGIDIHIPWTTGFGIGYRINDWLNVRAEPKWHKFEVYDMGAEQIESKLLTEYTTFTLGVGIYANWQPFENYDNFLKGFMVAPSVRYWPRISSSLDGNSTSITTASAGSVNHEAVEVGIAGTPFILNISIGYSIGCDD